MNVKMIESFPGLDRHHRFVILKPFGQESVGSGPSEGTTPAGAKERLRPTLDDPFLLLTFLFRQIVRKRKGSSVCPFRVSAHRRRFRRCGRSRPLGDARPSNPDWASQESSNQKVISIGTAADNSEVLTRRSKSWRASKMWGQV